MKVCKTCKLELPETEFNKCKNTMVCNKIWMLQEELKEQQTAKE
jgi:hypothetical protein